MPPNHAAAVIAEILGNDDLTQSWRAEIDIIRSRIKASRNALASAIFKCKPEYPQSHLRSQKGMFSCFSLNEKQLNILEEEHRIYLLPCGKETGKSKTSCIDYGRINFAAMAETQAERIAASICSL